MTRFFAHTSQLASHTSQVLADFQRDYPQFTFDHDLLAPAESFVARGKLFRGSLCLVAATELAHLSAPTAGAWAAAVALELAGSAILVQDDVMDLAELRRDKPTLHRQFAAHWRGAAAEKQHFGESAAVCVSDVLFFLATKTLIKADLPADLRLSLLEVMSTEIATLAMVQAEELRFSALDLSDPQVTEEMAIKILIGKTARYTAQWPLKLAGLLAGVDSATQTILAEYGEAMGLVFQLSDDRLGLFGDPALTGKDSDSDVKTGKKTLYAVYAHSRLQGAAAARFEQLYGKSDITPAEMTELQNLLRSQGIDTAVAVLTERYAEVARSAARRLGSYPTLTEILIETVDFLLERQR